MKTSQPVLVFAGVVALAVVILAAFIAFSSPYNKSLQREMILATPSDRSSEGLKPVKISEMRPNSARYFAYPSSYMLENENAYMIFILVRLPEESGGGIDDVSSFRAYSALSINSHCIMKYWPQEGRKRIEDPCHGDIVRVENGLLAVNTNRLMSGVFVAQPYLDLSADKDGYLYVEPPVWIVDKNGIVGIGRSATEDEMTDAAMRDLERIRYPGHNLQIPHRLTDGSVITPGQQSGQFLYLHPSDVRIEHLLEVSFCNCSERGSERNRGGQLITAWTLGKETIYTDVQNQSDTQYVAVTFFRNGYELVLYGWGFDKTVELVLDNFYKNMNRSMLTKISELERM